MPKDRTVVTVAYPGVIGRARMPRTALAHMPGWRVVGDGQTPVTGKQSRRARRGKTRRTGEPTTEPTNSPSSPDTGTEDQE